MVLSWYIFLFFLIFTGKVFSFYHFAMSFDIQQPKKERGSWCLANELKDTGALPLLDYLSRVFCQILSYVGLLVQVSCQILSHVGLLVQGLLPEQYIDLDDLSRIFCPNVILGWISCPDFLYGGLLVLGLLPEYYFQRDYLVRVSSPNVE